MQLGSRVSDVAVKYNGSRDASCVLWFVCRRNAYYDRVQNLHDEHDQSESEHTEYLMIILEQLIACFIPLQPHVNSSLGINIKGGGL